MHACIHPHSRYQGQLLTRNLHGSDACKGSNGALGVPGWSAAVADNVHRLQCLNRICSR